jgi:sugar diacid utilization regulator/putative methionine-R-sulfoxide reductase with GAF domain
MDEVDRRNSSLPLTGSALAPAQAAAVGLTGMSTVLERLGPATDRVDAYEALIRIGNRLHSTPGDVDAALALIVEQAQALLDSDLAWLVLADAEHGTLRPVVIRGFRSERFLDVELPIGLGVGGRAIAQQRPLVIDDYAAHPHETTAAVRDAMLAEDVVAVACAPMLKDDQVVGTLYVADRGPTAFSQEDAWLLGALATQASVAIESRRLYQRLRRQNELLERSFNVHRRLMEVSLQEAGLAGIGAVLAELIGLPVRIEQDVCEPRVLCLPDAAACADLAVPRVHQAIAAGTGRLGTIEVVGAARLTAVQTKALEQGTTLLALELLKQRATVEVGWRLSGELLEELLEAPQPVPAAVARRAERLHVDVAAPHRMLALAPAADHGAGCSSRLLDVARGMIAKRAPGHGSQALGVRRAGEVLLALPSALEADAEQVARAIQDALPPGAGPLLVGIGPLTVGFGATYRGAMACLNLARGARAPGAVVHYDTLGSLRFLLDAGDVRHAAAIAREPLDALIAHDAAHRTPLLATVRAFVECGGHHARTAERCFVAVSTLKYRLAKAERVLGAHPGDPELTFRLMLAFKVMDLLEVIGAAPTSPSDVSVV